MLRRNLPMRSVLLACAALLIAACSPSTNIVNTQHIVEDAAATVAALKMQEFRPRFEETLRGAQGVAIFPNLYKGAFFIGGEGGNGVVLVKDASGSWSHPAFYTLAAGSFGLQMGGQKARAVLVLRTQGAVKAIIENQAKLGADMGVSMATVGHGLEGAVTTNLGADIIAFNDAVGLYGGVSLEGAALVRRNDLNQDYYGQPSEPNDILFARQRTNAKADPLRAAIDVR